MLDYIDISPSVKSLICSLILMSIALKVRHSFNAEIEGIMRSVLGIPTVIVPVALKVLNRFSVQFTLSVKLRDVSSTLMVGAC